MDPNRRVIRFETARKGVAKKRRPANIRARSSTVEQGTFNHTFSLKAKRAESLGKTNGRPPLPALPIPESHARPIPLYVERARRLIG